MSLYGYLFAGLFTDQQLYLSTRIQVDQKTISLGTGKDRESIEIAQ
jgi:hypothetical protein